jgi:hypothetical protein
MSKKALINHGLFCDLSTSMHLYKKPSKFFIFARNAPMEPDFFPKEKRAHLCIHGKNKRIPVSTEPIFKQFPR